LNRKNIIHFEVIESTNDYLKKMADEVEDRTVVISDKQIKGRGRTGKVWQSNSNEGIWMSIILKPDIKIDKAPFITLIAAASIIKSLNDCLICAKIKWPNDIILNGKKLCGILTELITTQKGINIIVGIGMNVNTTNFSDEICKIATSLKKEGYEIDKWDLIEKILDHFEKLYVDYVENENKFEVIKICREYSAIIGKKIYMIKDNEKELVECLDIDENGNLIIINSMGERKNIISGEISIRGEVGYI
jgi:BirA family biotin operon repressor/biotin-[acetyl-CoA-carboxylase] ligase